MYEIREYEKNDKEELIELWIKVSVEEYGYKEWEEEIRILGVKEYDKILLAIDEGRIIGSMAYKKVDYKVVELKRVYLYKEYRGKGIANQLYNGIMETIKENKYKKVIVETWENFQSGISFYIKKGFKLLTKDGKRYVYILDIN